MAVDKNSLGGCLVLIVLLGAAFIIAVQRGCTAGSGSTNKVDAPLGTEDRLHQNIVNELGESNRNVKRITDYLYSRGHVMVVLAFNDNLTQDMVRLGIKMDVTNILKAIKESQCNFSRVSIE